MSCSPRTVPVTFKMVAFPNTMFGFDKPIADFKAPEPTDIKLVTQEDMMILTYNLPSLQGSIIEVKVVAYPTPCFSYFTEVVVTADFKPCSPTGPSKISSFRFARSLHQDFRVKGPCPNWLTERSKTHINPVILAAFNEWV
jgi:hypothetical protein